MWPTGLRKKIFLLYAYYYTQRKRSKTQRISSRTPLALPASVYKQVDSLAMSQFFDMMASIIILAPPGSGTGGEAQKK